MDTAERNATMKPVSSVPRTISALRSAVIGAARVLRPLVPIAILVVAWWAAAAAGLFHEDTLASPKGVIERFAEVVASGYQGVPLHAQILASLQRSVVGFVVAVLVGVPFGLLMGTSARVRWFFEPVFAMLRPVPAISFIPLLILWFGIGELPKVLIIFLACFLYIVINTHATVDSIPAGYSRVALMLGASRIQLFTRVILPAALPGIMTGLKVGLAISWGMVVAAELIGAQRGLGYMIIDAATFFRVRDIYIGIICIGLIGFCLNAIVTAVETRICHWRGK